MVDDTDNTMSDNNEDEKDKKEDTIIEKINVTQKKYMLSVVYEAHFSKINMNIFLDLFKKKNPLLIIKNMKYSWKIKQYINHRNNIKHKTLVYV